MITFCVVRCKLASAQCISFPTTIGSKELTCQESLDSELRPSAPNFFEAASLNDITERENLVPSTPTYMDFIMNKIQ